MRKVGRPSKPSVQDEEEDLEDQPPLSNGPWEIGGKEPRGKIAGTEKHLEDEAASDSERSDADEAIMEPMEPLRTSELSELWSSLGASFVEHNRCVVPSNFTHPDELAGATLDAYYHTRASASLFDLSFKVCLQISGADREFAADQFLTCNLRAMRSGDVQYACILDSKGLILDDAFVLLEDDAVTILTSGCRSKQLADYIGQYVVYIRRSGADVSFRISDVSVLGLQGPESRKALVSTLVNTLPDMQLITLSEEIPLAPSLLHQMPYMSALASRDLKEKVVILCAGMTGEDGFEIMGSSGLLTKLAGALLSSELVRPAGLFCLDMLRMEAGLPRVGADINVGMSTPVRCALSWTLDQSKMRNLE